MEMKEENRTSNEHLFIQSDQQRSLKHSPPAGLDWCCTNDLLVSGSLDGLVVVWDATSGRLLRTVRDQAQAQVTAVLFHPFNSNWLIVRATIYQCVLLIMRMLYTIRFGISPLNHPPLTSPSRWATAAA